MDRLHDDCRCLYCGDSVAVEDDESSCCVRVFFCGFSQRLKFTRESVGISEVGAYLHQFGAAVRMADEEVHFAATGCLDVAKFQ